MSEILNTYKTIIIAGGGTGGHIFPALAIAKALQQADSSVHILFIGALGKMEMQKIPEAGYQIIGLHIAGFNRNALWKNWNLPFKLIKSFLQVRSIFLAHKPVAVVGVGGYSTYPVVKWAQKKGVPTFLHESNSYPGKANVWLAKKATAVFVANHLVKPAFGTANVIVSGNPVRKYLLQQTCTLEAANKFFNICTHLPTILFVGGSLGASSINRAVQYSIAELSAKANIIWQTGNNDYASCATLAKKYDNVFVAAFIKEMDLAYKASAIVVSRAGAMAVSEIVELAKPSILVPYPFATDDHQTANANTLVNIGAAWLIKDADLPANLLTQLSELLSHPQTLNNAADKLKSLQRPNADEFIASCILKSIPK